MSGPNDHGTATSDIFSPEEAGARNRRYIVGVAINYRDTGRIFSLPKPYRHHHVIKVAAELGEETPITGTQGFILNDGRFCMRKLALRIARLAGQVDEIQGSILTSEDLW